MGAHEKPLLQGTAQRKYLFIDSNGLESSPVVSINGRKSLSRVCSPTLEKIQNYTTDYDKPVSSRNESQIWFLDVSARTHCLTVVVLSGQFLFFPVSHQLSSNKSHNAPVLSPVGRACYCSKLGLDAAAYSVPPNNIYFLLSSKSH